MVKKITVEGVLNLKMKDEDVKKNIESLKKINSKLDIASNISEIQKQIENLKNIDSKVDFNTNIDKVIKQLNKIKRTNTKIDVDDSEIKQAAKELTKMSECNCDVKVKVHRTEWDELKKELSQKFEITAVVSAAGAVVGGEIGSNYNDLVTVLRERGITKDQAEKLIATGLKSGYSMDELKDVVQYSNKATLQLMTENNKTALETMAAMIAAERSSQAGADDLSRMIMAMKVAGYTDKQQLAMLNLMVGEIQKGNTEIAESIRTYIPKLQGTGLSPIKMAEILSQMGLTSSEDVGNASNELYSVALAAKQQGTDVNTLLKSIKDNKPTQDMAKKLGLQYGQLLELHNLLQRVDLNKKLDNSTKNLDDLVSTNKDQRSWLEKIYDWLQSKGAKTGVLQYGGDLGAITGSLMPLIGGALVEALRGALKDIKLSKLKLPVKIEIPKLPKIKLPKIELPSLKGGSKGSIGLNLDWMKNLSKFVAKIKTFKMPDGIKNLGKYSKYLKDIGSALKKLIPKGFLSKMRFLGRAFTAIGIVLWPLDRLLKGDLKGAFIQLGVEIGEFLAPATAIGELAAGLILEIGKLVGVVKSTQNGFTMAREGILSFLGILSTLYGYITGDFSKAKDFFVEAFEMMGDSPKQAEKDAQKAIDGIKDKINGFMDFLKNLPQNAYNWGKDLLSNFIDGIKSEISNLENACSNIAKTVSDYLHHSTPEIGPLKNDDQWGSDFMENIIKGIESKQNDLKAAIFTTSKNMNVQPMTTSNSSMHGTYNTITVNVNVVGRNYDEQQLAYYLNQMLKKQIYR